MAERAPTDRRGRLREAAPLGSAFALVEAAKLGFTLGHPDWANLAQDQPESGALPDGPPRLSGQVLEEEDHGPTPYQGDRDLREAVAEHLNRLHRAGKPSQYGPENIAIGPVARLELFDLLVHGGVWTVQPLAAGRRVEYLPVRRALRTASGAHQLWTAAEQGFTPDVEAIAAELDRRAAPGALRISNPCDPTGALLEDDGLARLVALARARGFLLLVDESHGQYVWSAGGDPLEQRVSAAAHVEDVDADPVLIADGLGRSWRYPGWRVAWTAGPKAVIESLARIGHATDGGASSLAQRAALAALEPEYADREAAATRAHFAKKRKLLLRRLEEFGVRVPAPPRGTFHCWGSLDDLDARWREPLAFFRSGLQRRVITAPGDSLCAPSASEGDKGSWVRFSFGPPLDTLRMGLDRLAQMLRAT